MDPAGVCLLIRHLPSEFTDQEKIDFICHFGAYAVRPMGSRGPLKHTAFAKFHSREAAEKCLRRLHQLEVLEHKLVVEFAKAQHEKFLPSDSTEHKPKKNETETSEDSEVKEKPPSEKTDDVFRKHDIPYPKKPSLYYMYPPPTVSTLTNIANALASQPRFYTQVLHLMNKMNLPCPFGPVTPSPPLALENPKLLQDRGVNKAVAYTADGGDINEIEMEYPSTEESEIESDNESKANRNQTDEVAVRKSVKRPRKRMRLVQPDMSSIVKPSMIQQPSEVFEAANSRKATQIQFNLSETDIVYQLQKARNESEANKESENHTESDTVTVVGFGKVEPQKKVVPMEEVQKADVNYIIDQSSFLDRKVIEKGRLKKEQMKDFSVFKNYQAGEPTSRLYLKNLTKHTTEQELMDLFGSFVDWSHDLASETFDIRIMKEGRMKGQAFITLPSEVDAQNIMKNCNAYILNNKPIVIQYARSAKAKQVDKPIE